MDNGGMIMDKKGRSVKFTGLRRGAFQYYLLVGISKKRISSIAHGLTDYAMSMLLWESPFLFHFNQEGPEAFIPVAVGTVLFLNSVLTDYELGFLAWVPMRAHLLLDGFCGLFLAASPWIFDFYQEVFKPHLFMGLFLLLIVFYTIPMRQKKGFA